MNNLNAKAKPIKSTKIDSETLAFYIDEMERLGITNTQIAKDVNKTPTAVSGFLKREFYSRLIHESILKHIKAQNIAQLAMAAETAQHSNSSLEKLKDLL